MSVSVTRVVFCLMAVLATAAAQTAGTASGRDPAGTGATAMAGVEPVDLAAYAAIRDEGLNHSHAMEFATTLADDFGPRLTGSANLSRANEWARNTLVHFGSGGAHLEDFGEFGLQWQQINTWMRMSAPDNMVFVVQAAPWSVSSQGPTEAEATLANIAGDADFARYRGKLSGKVVFLGPVRATPMPLEPFAHRLTQQELDSGVAVERVRHYYQIRPQRLMEIAQRNAFRDRLKAFLEDEHVLAVVLPSADGNNGGGTGDLEVDDSGTPGTGSWQIDKRAGFPVVIAAIEHFGRVARLLERAVPVKVQFDVQTRDERTDSHGYNVVADFPGYDPKLKRQVVLLGAHMDSWSGGTGATDDGAGVAITLEAARILSVLDLRHRRTVRVVLYGGEEEGLLGTVGYARQHLGELPRSNDPVQQHLIWAWRAPSGQVRALPGYADLSVAYDIDHGGGRLRGVYTAGNSALIPIFKQWIAPLGDLGVSVVVDSPTWPSDQSVYTDLGLPGIAFVQDPLDYETRSHHTNMDTVERLSPPDLAQAAVVEAIFVLNSANRDGLLPRATLSEVAPSRRIDHDN